MSAVAGLVRQRGALIGLVILATLATMAVAAPWLGSRDPIRTAPREALQPPGGRFVLGSDQFGRDVASLIEAIRSARKSVRNATGRPEFAARWGWFAAALLLLGIAVAAGGYVFKSVTPLPVATGALERAWGKAKALLGQSKDAAQKGMEAAKPMVDKAKEAVGTAAATAKEAVKKPSRTRDEPSERTRGKPDPPERTREKYDPPLREAPSDGTRGLSPPAAPPGQ